jgi:hypothetical protein
LFEYKSRRRSITAYSLLYLYYRSEKEDMNTQTLRDKILNWVNYQCDVGVTIDPEITTDEILSLMLKEMRKIGEEIIGEDDPNIVNGKVPESNQYRNVLREEQRKKLSEILETIKKYEK